MYFYIFGALGYFNQTASDSSSGHTYEKGHVIEEPNEAKVSSSVLKTSGSCEGVA
jgi:hypothetical protein